MRGEAGLGGGQQKSGERGAQRRQQPFVGLEQQQRHGRHREEGENAARRFGEQKRAGEYANIRGDDEQETGHPVGSDRAQPQHRQESGQESQLPKQAASVSHHRFHDGPGRHDDGAAECIDVAKPQAFGSVDGQSAVDAKPEHSLDRVPDRLGPLLSLAHTRHRPTLLAKHPQLGCQSGARAFVAISRVIAHPRDRETQARFRACFACSSYARARSRLLSQRGRGDECGCRP